MQKRVIFFKQKKTGKKVQVPLADDLDAHLQFLSEFIENDFVCPGLAERGSGGANGLSESFNRIAKRAKIDCLKIEGKGMLHFNRLTFHSLRHSFNPSSSARNELLIFCRQVGQFAWGFDPRRRKIGL